MLELGLMNNFKRIWLAILTWVFLFWNFSFAWNSFVRTLLWTQLEIWLSQRSYVWDLRDWTARNSLSIHQEIVNQNKYDLISQLDKAKSEKERLQIIDQYIVSLNTTVSNGKNLGNYEQSQVDYYNKAAKDCESPIKSKNSEFSSAVKSYNYEKAEIISKEIAELRACVAKNQVYAKAHASYASASKSLSSLQKKADYLVKNREKVAKYYEILKPDLLKELYEISKVVENDF